MLLTDLVLESSVCVDWISHLPFILHLAVLGLLILSVLCCYWWDVNVAAALLQQLHVVTVSHGSATLL